jgi:hypothetical protein
MATVIRLYDSYCILSSYMATVRLKYELVYIRYFKSQTSSPVKAYVIKPDPTVSYSHCHLINHLTPELNPSAQRCLARFFTGDFAS